MNQVDSLHDGWSLRIAPDGFQEGVPLHVREAMPIPATVPGTVHTDLLGAGLIPDPYVDQNELTLDWIGKTTWVYSRELPVVAPDSGEPVLAFDGLDTIARLSIDGFEIGRTANQHRRYEFPLGEALAGEGPHLLEVRFDSVWDVIEEREAVNGTLPRAYPAAFNQVRKSACNFGWDWGPSLVTAGIWREARLLVVTGPRFVHVGPRVTLEGPRGIVEVNVELAEPAPADLVVRASVDGSESACAVPTGGTRAQVSVVVDDLELWWPHGLGGQPLSNLVVRLEDEAGAVRDEWSERIGFRGLRLNTEPDAEGTPFVFEINGATVPARGANWIPDDVFLTRVDEERLRRRLTQARDANINLLRVWGGGVYESGSFYRLCDELGILVWQDFLFACAAYPEDEQTAAEVEAEAIDNVRRLMPHPSLVLWNGNNENIWGFFDWEWKPQLDGRAWGEHYYLSMLPRIVEDADPSRPYWAGSPYSGTMDIHPNDDDHGLRHIWDVWNEVDYVAYRDYRPRFASEFGWQAPPTWSTIVESIRDRPLTQASPGMLHHQKASDGNGKLERGLEPHFVVPEDLADWHFAMQLNQARAVSLGIEYYRSLRPRNFGTIVWQLNDCWPVTSWAAVDGYGRKKPLWYGMRRSYAERLLSVQPRGAGLVVSAVNDRGESWRESFIARRLSFDGVTLATFSGRFAVDRFGGQDITLPVDVAMATDASRELLEVTTASGIRALWFYAEDRDLAYSTPEIEVVTRREGSSVDVDIRAMVLVRDLVILADRVDPAAEADDALIMLLPGESATIRVRGVPEGREAELTTAPVLRTANDLVVKH